jgi:hypothetical protein
MAKQKLKRGDNPSVFFEQLEVNADAVVNGAPLEMTDRLMEELVQREEEKEEEKEKVHSRTEHYNNGANIWRLIAKTYNVYLSYEHVTTAMVVPGGVLVCVKEAVGQKSDSSVCFIPNARLVEIDSKWVIC